MSSPEHGSRYTVTDYQLCFADEFCVLVEVGRFSALQQMTRSMAAVKCLDSRNEYCSTVNTAANAKMIF